MSFSYVLRTVEPFSVEGNFRVVRGTYTNDGGSTGGDIVTGLNQIHDFQTMHTLNPVLISPTADADTINAILPTSTGTITIITAPDMRGNWTAIGR